MKLYGLMVAQNEGDIIFDTLTFLRRLNVFEKIFFFDLGSEDDTLTKALQFADLLHEPQRLDRVYTEGLRFELLSGQRHFFEDGDWLSIVDADEFYEDDPRPLIELAEREGATCVRTYQAEFMLTDLDLAAIAHEDPSRPVIDRRRHYLIQWSEDRFFKFLPDADLLSGSRPCSKKLVNRHYQYPTPEQIALRIRTRLTNKVKARQLPNRQTWPQIFSRHWTDYVTPHRILHRDDGGELRFGLPDGLQWKDYYSRNPFSTIFPQVALALEREHDGRMVPITREENTSAPNAGNLLRDDYRTRVVWEMTRNLQVRRFRAAGRALFVLLLHTSRWCRTTLLPVMRCKLASVVESFCHQLFSTGRRLLRRPTGTITAHPNPIVRPQLSWQGATSLKWRSWNCRVEVRIGAPDGRVLSASASKGTLTTGPWVEDATIFFLQDTSEGRPLTSDHTLGRVTVRVIQAAYLDNTRG